ncbi:MAG: ClbS/DfsB family four-helix bundle protein [Anaerolineales bacterium]
MNKTELLDWLHEENRKWNAFLAEIGPARMELPGVNGDWSIKDMLGHLTTWHRDLVVMIQAAIAGEDDAPTPWPIELEGDIEINAWIYEYNRERPLDEVLEETRQTIGQLIAVIESLPEDLIIEPERRVIHVGGKRFAAGEFFDHFHEDHESDMRAWMAEN